MKKPRTNPQKWVEALGRAMISLEALEIALEQPEGQASLNSPEVVAKLVARLQEALKDVLTIYERYEEWYDGMPGGALASPSGEKLEAVLEIVVEPTVRSVLEWKPTEPRKNQFQEIKDLLKVCLEARLPAGFGRD